jgi:hypothetical protein
LNVDFLKVQVSHRLIIVETSSKTFRFIIVILWEKTRAKKAHTHYHRILNEEGDHLSMMNDVNNQKGKEKTVFGQGEFDWSAVFGGNKMGKCVG